MGSVRTSILRRPRPLPPHRRADHPEVSSYTLDWEEPVNRELSEEVAKLLAPANIPKRLAESRSSPPNPMKSRPTPPYVERDESRPKEANESGDTYLPPCSVRFD